MTAPTPRELRRKLDFSGLLAERGWYHSFELPNGRVIEGVNTIETLRTRWARYPLPADLTGKRVLDIGAWDGWFSFEAERRGASVIAIDCVEIPNFLEMQRLLESKVDYRILDFYELPEAGLGRFDYVFCLGVLYHLKHPLLALEIVCGLTTDVAIIDSFVIDGDTWEQTAGEIPTLEFYETDELGGQLDNWFGPSVGSLQGMCRAAGFARVDTLHARAHNAAIACYRKWEPAANDVVAAPAPELHAAVHTRNLGLNFYTRKEEYISCWIRTPVAALTRDDVRCEVGDVGVPAIYVRRDSEDVWLANFRLPPGLTPGWKDVRLRLKDSAFSNPVRIAVDVLPVAGALEIVAACDGRTWESGTAREYVSCWIRGLGENSDRANLELLWGGERLAIDWIGPEDAERRRQVNAKMPPGPHDQRTLRVRFGGKASEAVGLRRVS